MNPLALTQSQQSTPRLPGTWRLDAARAVTLRPREDGMLRIRPARRNLNLRSRNLRFVVHARRIELDHPRGGTLIVEAPLSPEMKAGFAHFGFSEDMSADGFVSLSRKDAGFHLIFLRTGLKTFKPEGLLADINGEPENGTWNLRVNDNAGGDTGYINQWSITF